MLFLKCLCFFVFAVSQNKQPFIIINIIFIFDCIDLKLYHVIIEFKKFFQNAIYTSELSIHYYDITLVL